VLDAGEHTVKVTVVGDLHLPPSLAPWKLQYLLSLTRHSVHSRIARSLRRGEHLSRRRQRHPPRSASVSIATTTVWKSSLRRVQRTRSRRFLLNEVSVPASAVSQGSPVHVAPACMAGGGRRIVAVDPHLIGRPHAPLAPRASVAGTASGFQTQALPRRPPCRWAEFD
jgi:hypothetical protein